jgi:hypothetical protein
MQLANSQIHRNSHFGENPRSAGILSPKQEEEVSRNDAKAQRKSLFVAPLREAFFSFYFAAQPTIHAGMTGFELEDSANA